MIVLISGPRGSGKTSLCRRLLEEMKGSPVPTWTNLGEEGNLTEQGLDRILASVSAQCTIQNFVLDEAYSFFDSRMTASRVNRKVAYIANSIEGVFIAAVQDIESVDSRIRSNYSIHVKCESFDYPTSKLVCLVTRVERGRLSLDLDSSTSLIGKDLFRTFSPPAGIWASE